MFAAVLKSATRSAHCLRSASNPPFSFESAVPVTDCDGKVPQSLKLQSHSCFVARLRKRQSLHSGHCRRCSWRVRHVQGKLVHRPNLSGNAAQPGFFCSIPSLPGSDREKHGGKEQNFRHSVTWQFVVHRANSVRPERISAALSERGEPSATSPGQLSIESSAIQLRFAHGTVQLCGNVCRVPYNTLSNYESYSGAR